jgi:hypothetical protein
MRASHFGAFIRRRIDLEAQRSANTVGISVRD